ncbi:MAG TPA: hypothetical protein VIQ29_23970 [Ancylobacter sp.]
MIGARLGPFNPSLFGRAAPPLDGVPGLFAASGLRRLVSSYTGPLVRLRRSSDNAESDFSAGPGAWLDEAAVLAWCGGASAYARTQYGQAGGLDLVMITAAAQPRLVNAGVMETMGGRPALRFLGAQWLAGSFVEADFTSRVGVSIGSIVVGQLDAGAAISDATYWATSTAGGLYRTRVQRNIASAVAGDTTFVSGGAVIASTGPYPVTETGPHMLEHYLSATRRAARRDGVAMPERSGVNAAPNTNALRLVVGRATNGGATDTNFFLGWLSELVVMGNCSDADVAATGAALRPAWGL